MNKDNKGYFCKHCGNFITNLFNLNKIGNHYKWCEKNPNARKPKINNQKFLQILEYARSKITKESIDKMREKIRYYHKIGKYKDSYKKTLETKRKENKLKHKEETKKLLSQKARESNHRRLVRSTRVYETKSGEKVLLDSTWEEILARRLDSLGIKWIRPSYLEYIDKDGLKRKYFPDFYLLDYDLYLDPKNRAAFNQQKEKINCLIKQYKNIIFIFSKEFCENFSIESILFIKENQFNLINNLDKIIDQ